MRTYIEDTYWGHPLRTHIEDTRLIISVSITTTQTPALTISATTTKASRSLHSPTESIGRSSYIPHTLVHSPQQQLSHPIQRKELSASHASLNINFLLINKLQHQECSYPLMHVGISTQNPVPPHTEKRGPLLQYITHQFLTSSTKPVTNITNFPILWSTMHLSISPAPPISYNARDQHHEFSYPPYCTCHISLFLHH